MIRPVEQRKQRSVGFHLRYVASHAVPTRVPNVIALSSVAVVGLGYIGLPTAVSLATGGLEVTGVDVNPGIVERVNRGEAPFAEPDLSVAVSGAGAMGRLRAQRRPRRSPTCCAAARSSCWSRRRRRAPRGGSAS